MPTHCHTYPTCCILSYPILSHPILFYPRILSYYVLLSLFSYIPFSSHPFPFLLYHHHHYHQFHLHLYLLLNPIIRPSFHNYLPLFRVKLSIYPYILNFEESNICTIFRSMREKYFYLFYFKLKVSNIFKYNFLYVSNTGLSLEYWKEELMCYNNTLHFYITKFEIKDGHSSKYDSKKDKYSQVTFDIITFILYLIISSYGKEISTKDFSILFT